MKKLFGIIAFLLFAGSANAQLWVSQISTASGRAYDWQHNAGANTIPSATWTQSGSTIPSSASAATIITAINACGTNHYIQLGIGTFSLSASVLFTGPSNSNCELRGMGADQTILNFSATSNCQGYFCGVGFISTDTNYNGGPSNLANWTAGYSAGVTSITLDSKTNLQVGWPLMLDQLDDTTDSGAVFICSTASCAQNGDGGIPRPGRGQEQLVTVTSISGGSCPCTIGITPAITMPNWRTGQTPQAWWPTSPISNAGMQNLTIEGSVFHNAAFFNCVNCWEQGVRSIGPSIGSALNWRSHTAITWSPHAIIQSNYFVFSQDSHSVKYGVEISPGADCLITNNIFEALQAPYPSDGAATGCVIAYNFDVNNVYSGTPPNFLNQSGFPHAVGDEHIIYEGNIGAGIYSDNFHGTHHFVTLFRNYWNGYQKTEGTLPTSDNTPIITRAFSRFYNYIGNVLGNPADHASESDLFGSIGAGLGVPNDFTNTAGTLMRWGNFLNCSGASPCQTGFFSSGEVPSGLTGAQAPFLLAVPGNNNLPNSYFLTTQPSFWPNGKPWPNVGPDVTGGNVKWCTGGTYDSTYVLTSGQCPGGSISTLAAGHVNSNPAMDCFLNTMGGKPDGTDSSALTFNASTCYPAGASAPPSVPTKVMFAGHGNVRIKGAIR